MDTNQLPVYDQTDNPTGCCPRFNPEGWDKQSLRFDDKLFLRARTRSLFHIPVNMGPVFSRTFKAIDDAGAAISDGFVVMSHDPSPWRAEHLFSVGREVPGHECVRLSGNFQTRVFEGPFKDVGRWQQQFEKDLAADGKKAARVHFFYTSCPKCAKAYGKNYVVGIAELE